MSSAAGAVFFFFLCVSIHRTLFLSHLLLPVFAVGNYLHHTSLFPSRLLFLILQVALVWSLPCLLTSCFSLPPSCSILCHSLFPPAIYSHHNFTFPIPSHSSSFSLLCCPPFPSSIPSSFLLLHFLPPAYSPRVFFHPCFFSPPPSPTALLARLTLTAGRV